MQNKEQNKKQQKEKRMLALNEAGRWAEVVVKAADAFRHLEQRYTPEERDVLYEPLYHVLPYTPEEGEDIVDVLVSYTPSSILEALMLYEVVVKVLVDFIID